MLALKRKHLSVFALLILQFLLSVAGGILFAFTPREDVIFPGVSINGVNIGGLRVNEAIQVLNRAFKSKMADGDLELYCGDQMRKVAYSELEVKYDVSATVNEVLEQQNNSAEVPSVEMLKTNVRKPDYPLVYSLNNEKLTRFLQSAARSSEIEVRNAKIMASDRNLKIVPEQDGQQVNFSQTEKNLRERVARLNGRPVKIEVAGITPAVTAGELTSITGSIGLGVSHFPRAEREKYMVITSAVKLLDGVLIAPGESFSFNKVMGTNVQEQNYLDARTIQKEGRSILVSDNAMSQVASTLYEAVLYSELKVTERRIHAQMPGYVPTGRDAAVGMDKMDFKFENNSRNPVYISAQVKDNYLTINLLGVKKKGRTVQVISSLGDDAKSPGTVLATVYRVIYDEGNESRRELISVDRYMAGPDRR